MAAFCFAERPRELFVEGVARGWLQAVLDFPRYKSHEEAQAAAQCVPYDLAPEVCCIPPGDDYPYRFLVVHAWVYSYMGVVTRATERLITQAAFHTKQLSAGENLAAIRAGFLAEREIQEEIDRAWLHFQTRQRESRTPV